MRFHELEAAIKAGIPVFRKSWASGYSLVKYFDQPAMFRRCPGRTQDLATLFADDLFADDWVRDDGLGRDVADANEDIANLMMCVGDMVMGAVQNPGKPQVLHVSCAETMKQVQVLLAQFSELVVELHIGPCKRGTAIHVTWPGDAPSKKQPPANFKRIINKPKTTGRETEGERK